MGAPWRAQAATSPASGAPWRGSGSGLVLSLTRVSRGAPRPQPCSPWGWHLGPPGARGGGLRLYDFSRGCFRLFLCW